MKATDFIAQKTEITVSDLKAGDVIYVHPTENATPYLVLDVGHPFILIENMKSHFASLYRPEKVYKQIISKD